jgi:hypothetical protein
MFKDMEKKFKKFEKSLKAKDEQMEDFQSVLL